MGPAIAFVQKKRGTGKTTLLTHLAHSWAHSGKTVGLIDLDPRKSVTHWATLNRELSLNLGESHYWRAAGNIRDSCLKHDITLVDCPTNVEATMHSSIAACDIALVPCPPTGIDAWAAKGVLKICVREKTPAFVVMTRMPSNEGESGDIVRELTQAGARILETGLGNRIAFAAGLLSGGGTPTDGHSLSAYAEIEALRQEIDSLLGQIQG